MPKTETAAPAAATNNPPASSTNWGAFSKAQLVPSSVTCLSYRPIHRVDNTCHSKILLSAEAVKRHIEMGHSGAFQMLLRHTDKSTDFWQGLSDTGLESIDLRCEICDAVIPFHPNHISKHMKPHNGKSKRVIPGGLFNVTISTGQVAPSEEDAFDING